MSDFIGRRGGRPRGGGNAKRARPRSGRDWSKTMDRYTQLQSIFEDGPEAVEGMSWKTLNSGVLLFRTKEIRSGDMLEVACYPILSQ